MLDPEQTLEFVRTESIAEPVRTEGAAVVGGEPLDLDQLPPGLVSGSTLINFDPSTSGPVRAGVSLSMLFASRVASAKMKPADDEDDWLAHYTAALHMLGFSGAGFAVVKSQFKKNGLFVHEAIIPWLTMALGGGALGPIMMKGLQTLGEMDKDSPWITLFEQESRRFNAHELHFAAVETDAGQSRVKYAVARLDFAQNATNILFFKLTSTKVDFQSATTTLSVNNSLMAAAESELRLRLEAQTRDFIREAKF